MAEALKAAGCREAWIGAESGSQRILDAMDKGTTVEEILTARERLREQGIRVGFFIQLGYLGEELEDIIATRRLIDEARPDDIGVSVSYPLPGTRFYERVKEQLGDKTRWSESDDLSMMFQGTYRSEFYKARARPAPRAGHCRYSRRHSRRARRRHATVGSTAVERAGLPRQL